MLTFETRTAGTLSSSKRKIVAHVLLHGVRHWAQIATLLRQKGYRQDWLHDFIVTERVGIIDVLWRLDGAETPS